MATTTPPVIVPSSTMGPDVLAMLLTVRDEVAKTIAALGLTTQTGIHD